MRVGAFASVAGVSAKVLRDYDARGVFRPAWVDPASGYRMYSPTQLPQLRRILALRDVGVGLDAIRDLVSDGSDLTGVLRHHRAALERQRRELDRRLRVLGVHLAGSTGPDVVVRVVPAMRVAVLPVDSPADVERAFYDLERRVQRAKARAPLPPGMLAATRGRNASVYVPVRRGSTGRFTVETLAGVRAATLLHHGSYAGLERSRRLLRQWLRTAGIPQQGVARTVYLRFGAEPELKLRTHYLTDRTSELLTELQLPIETVPG
jgi:DNA-binding transcriptional MerR regulator